MSNKPKILEIRRGILEANDREAQALREDFAAKGVKVINVVSSPGSGKTELLTVLSKQLISNGKKVSIIVGDLATDNDAKRLSKSGANTFQINTNGNCHLEAKMIARSLSELPWHDADVLFIENVGNLVCPANYDLGESLRMVLISVTEGEDKPLKYPTMFHSADVCVISKFDLAAAVGFDETLARENIASVNSDMQIINTSAKEADSIQALIKLLGL